MKKFCHYEQRKKQEIEDAKRGITRREFVARSAAALMFPTIGGILKPTEAQAAFSDMRFIEIFRQGGPMNTEFVALDKGGNILGDQTKLGFAVTGFGSTTAAANILNMGALVYRTGMISGMQSVLGNRMNQVRIQVINHSGNSDNRDMVSVASHVASILGGGPTVAGFTDDANLAGSRLIDAPEPPPVAISNNNPPASLGRITSPAQGGLSAFANSLLNITGIYSRAIASAQLQASSQMAGSTSSRKSIDESSQRMAERYALGNVVPNVAGDTNIQGAYGTTIAAGDLFNATIMKGLIDGTSRVAVLSPTQGAWDYHNGNFNGFTSMHAPFGVAIGRMILASQLAGFPLAISIKQDGGMVCNTTGGQGDANDIGTLVINIFSHPTGTPNVIRPYVGAVLPSNSVDPSAFTVSGSVVAPSPDNAAKAALASVLDFAATSGAEASDKLTRAEIQSYSAFRSGT